MKVGDYDIEVTSERTSGGWRAVGVLPNGHKVASAPQTTREQAEHDVHQQVLARLYPQRRYDVNRPFESLDDDDWKDVTGQPYVVQAMGVSGLTEEQLRNLWWNSAAHVYNWKDFCDHIAEGSLDAQEFIDTGIPIDHQVDFSKKQKESMDLNERKLSSQARKNLPKGQFVFPGERRYPIEDKPHARNALARVSQHGSPSEKAKVRGAVHRKYPGIGEAEEAVVMHQADQLLEALSTDWVPPHQPFEDEDAEIGMAAKNPWNAWEYAQRTKRNHPKLAAAIKGSPFEADYNRFFQTRPKAAFYPSDGGSAGGGGGFTSA